MDSPTDQTPLLGMQQAIVNFGPELLLCASNQGGVAASYKSIGSAIMEFEFLFQLYPELDAACFCPDYAGKLCYVLKSAPDADFSPQIKIYDGDSYRKPGPGMLKLIQSWYRNDLLYVGDRPEDEQAASAANIPYLHINAFIKEYS
ncbi:MAG: polynucleotide kinase [Spirulina sp. SIO3F2]|nr:polynucleotide kinase [Spirulina sp. SIO3F2]